MIFNARDKITRGLLSLARSPLPFHLYYRRHFPVPSVILIENTNCCNAHCVMCPREKLTRKPGFMAFALFEKIIREVSGAKRKPIVHLHGFGEPLLDESLLWDGRAVTCCMDYNGAQGVGDLNSQTVMEIWNGPVFSDIRKNFGKLDYSGFPVCQCCDWVHRR